MVRFYDIIIFGGGIAGLWLANRLKRAGYNLIVIEKDAVGSGQTLASQGMIHGGQKYTLKGGTGGHAQSIAAMPARWEACFSGWGDIDLSRVRSVSETQVMWKAGGSWLSGLAILGAARAVNKKTVRLKPVDFPLVLQEQKAFRGPVYELPERVLETKSLLAALTANLAGRVLRGSVQELLPDGQVAVDGQVLGAQLVIFAAGTGNEEALKLMRVAEQKTQRRPLRQIMVRPLPAPLFGHGIVGQPKPRVTVTSHIFRENAAGDPEYVWYLGGNVAEKAAAMTEEEAIVFARAEMQEMFPQIDWAEKEWATLAVDRAEPFDVKGQLPPGPFLHQRGRILLCWPTKLTFAPALADRVFDWLQGKDIQPVSKEAPPPLPQADIGLYPWEAATWRKS